MSMEDIEATLAAVQEEKNTLEIELADIRGECMAVKSLKKSIEQRLESCTRKCEEEVILINTCTLVPLTDIYLLC